MVVYKLVDIHLKSTHGLAKKVEKRKARDHFLCVIYLSFVDIAHDFI